VLRRLRLLVRPDTVLGWHRDLMNRRHARTCRPKRPGRPPTVRSIRALVLRLVIPEGAGPCQASDLGLFVAVCWVPGTGAGQALVRFRGQGSTGGRPRRGLALMPAPRWRSVFVPGGISPGLWGGRVLQRPMWTDGNCQNVSGCRSSLRHRHWVAWSAAAAARRGQSDTLDHATNGGGQTRADLASWLRPDGAHAGRVRQRMCPSRSP
jgi:hypothetical protein